MFPDEKPVSLIFLLSVLTEYLSHKYEEASVYNNGGYLAKVSEAY